MKNPILHHPCQDHKKVPLAVPLVRAFRDPALEVRVMELPPKMLGAAEVCGAT